MTLSVVLGSTDIHDKVSYGITADPARWAQGDRLVLPLVIYGADQDAVEANRRAILSELNAAETAWRQGRESERVTLAAQLNTTDTISWQVRRGRVTPARWYPAGTFGRATLELETETRNGRPVAELSSDARSASGTLTNGAATVLLADVTGDWPARTRFTFVDTSSTGVVNRLRISAVSAASAVVGDWDPWIDIDGASANQSDATAFGGSYETRTLSSASTWSYVGTAVQPAGALNTGWRQMWLRLRDNATVMAAPTSLTATVLAASQVQVATGNSGGGGTSVSATWGGATTAGNHLLLAVKVQHEDPPEPEQVQDAIDSDTADTTPSVSWGGATVAGNHLVMVLRFEGDLDDWTMPGGWQLGEVDSNPGSPNVHTALLYQENAASDSGAVSGGSFGVATDWTMWIAEYSGLAASQTIVSTGRGSGDSTNIGMVALDGAPSVDRFLVVGAIANNDNTATSFGAPSGGYTQRGEEAGLLVADKATAASGVHTMSALLDGTLEDYVGVSVAFAAAPATAEPVVITPPTGYALAGIAQNLDEGTAAVTTALFYRENASSESGSKSVTFDRTVVAEARLMEYANVAPSQSLVAVVTATTEGVASGIGPTAIAQDPHTFAVALFGAYRTSTSYGFYQTPFAEVSDSRGLAVAVATAGQSQAWSASAVASAVDQGAHLLAVFRDESSTLTQALGTGGTNAADDNGLPAGSYAVRVQAVNAAGDVGAATASASPSLTVAGSSIALSWSAPTATSISHYRITVQDPDGDVWVADTPDNSTSYTISELTTWETAAALPSTSTGSYSASPAIIQARVRTTDADTDNAQVIKTTRSVRSLIGDWHMVDVGASYLPLQQEMADGGIPEWAVDFYARNAGGASYALHTDALNVAGPETGITLWYPGLDLGTKRTWVCEVRADGSVVAWLEDGSGNYVGSVAVAGSLRLAAGDNIVSIAMEQAGGVSAISAARGTFQATLYPQVDWLT